MTPSPLELGLFAFILGCALGAALLRDTLAAIMAFAAYSLGISILWVVLQAPDVGLTEAAVGAGVMTILFLLTLAKTVRPSTDRLVEPIGWRSVGLVAIFVLALGLTLPSLPAVGASGAPIQEDPVTQHYLDNAYEETGVHNAVTAVLAAYRGLDTLGEAIVVFTAVVATMVVLRREVVA